MPNLEMMLFEVTDEKMRSMGFTKEDDGSGDPRGISWDYCTPDYFLTVDAYGDVYLMRLQPEETDSLGIKVKTLAELQDVIDWMKP